ncbi:uncharacterized protein MYCFIDRAFT_208496 [Pseudocercospora fijiensis CIRAD86]|uniref:Uncharacterized protein n=1 Tax=Pseudocercospora fijiensis (strain CIRAD86) TaxID=383855 RepID=M3ARS4_PSEFD|nr:uncharacterized protein MYCFIDRAFT_208496 [Pseudocercospora fijiensis CIRAD86]EME80152.1 hypothetical protein MYCFIDRAFT_208496 [Pseudocercospora fijiensis CIRAD86]
MLSTSTSPDFDISPSPLRQADPILGRTGARTLVWDFIRARLVIAHGKDMDRPESWKKQDLDSEPSPIWAVCSRPPRWQGEDLLKLQNIHIKLKYKLHQLLKNELLGIEASPLHGITLLASLCPLSRWNCNKIQVASRTVQNLGLRRVEHRQQQWLTSLEVNNVLKNTSSLLPIICRQVRRTARMTDRMAPVTYAKEGPWAMGIGVDRLMISLRRWFDRFAFSPDSLVAVVRLLEKKDERPAAKDARFPLMKAYCTICHFKAAWMPLPYSWVFPKPLLLMDYSEQKLVIQRSDPSHFHSKV